MKIFALTFAYLFSFSAAHALEGRTVEVTDPSFFSIASGSEFTLLSDMIIPPYAEGGILENSPEFKNRGQGSCRIFVHPVNHGRILPKGMVLVVTGVKQVHEPHWEISIAGGSVKSVYCSFFSEAQVAEFRLRYGHLIDLRINNIYEVVSMRELGCRE